VQAWAGDSSAIGLLSPRDDVVPGTGVYAVGFLGDDWQVGGWHNDTVRQAAQWLRDNAPEDAEIMVNWEWHSSLYFYLGGLRRLKTVPLVTSYEGYESMKPPHVLFLWPFAGGSRPGYRLDAVLEDMFLAAVEEQGVDYIVVTPLTNFLSLYLCANPGFEQVASLGRGAVKIFRVIDATPLPEFPIHIEPRTITLLARTLQVDPASYVALAQDFFVQALGWTEAQVVALSHGQLSSATVEVNHVYYCYDVMEYSPLAQMYLEQGKVQEAIEQYQAAIRLDPDCPAPHEALGDVYLMQSKVAEAVGEYEKAISFMPGTVDYHLELGFMLHSRSVDEKATERAIEEYLKAIERAPDSPEGYTRLGAAYLALGGLYEEQGERELAIAAYQQAAETDPDLITPHLYLGKLYHEMGEVETAVAAYEQAIALHSDSAAAYVLLGGLYEDVGDVKKALRVYERAIIAVPDSQWAHLGLGRVHETMGLPDQAIEAYEQALALDPDNFEVYVRLIRVYSALAQDAKTAVADQTLNDACIRALSVLPDNARVMGAVLSAYQAVGRERFGPQLVADLIAELAVLYESGGDVEDALTVYQQSVIALPDSPEAHLGLGVIYETLGRTEEAAAECKRALELNPSGQLRQVAERCLEKLTNGGG